MSPLTAGGQEVKDAGRSPIRTGAGRRDTQRTVSSTSWNTGKSPSGQSLASTENTCSVMPRKLEEFTALLKKFRDLI